MDVKVDYNEFDHLDKAVQQYGRKSIKTINEVIHKEAPEIIKNNIQGILPVSGRRWKGKVTDASRTKPFKEDTDEELSVTVKTKYKYHYLYFPDDGSNTRRHVGNQQFMKRGAEKSRDGIIDICVGRLAQEFGG